ncbi:MAG: cytochrome c [Candidatus Rokuibacteriota bacterium]|nr:MAG: cytochrome c [Candidatus Rokubacteria bacterium]
MRPRVMFRATLLMLGVTALTLAACRTTAQTPSMTAAEAIDARQKLMKEQGKAWKDIQDKTKAGQIAAIVPDAEKLASTSKQIPGLFPEGSLNPDKSLAKPEIWQKRADFDAAAKNLETWSVKLRDAAKANDAEQTQAIVKDFGRQACGTCHQPFRVPPKQQ